MKNHVSVYPHFIVCEFQKPLYSHESVDIVRLNEKYVLLASQTSKSLVIRTPHGEGVYYPKQVKREFKKVEEIFLRPDEPMKLYEIPVSHSERSDMDKWKFS